MFIMQFATIWIKQYGIMLSKISQKVLLDSLALEQSLSNAEKNLHTHNLVF